MTKVSSLVCMASAMLLIFGTAIADDNTQNEQAKPAVTTNPDNQSKPKEVTADTPPSQDNAAKTKEVPAQGAPAQAEPDCNN